MASYLDRLARYSKRFNQFVLCLPVWAALGIADLFRWKPLHSGWESFERPDRPERRY